jgi:hypothetical protein
MPAFSQTMVDIKAYGQKVLDGQVKLSVEDKKVDQLLDSLFCVYPTDKDFYFKVANRILKDSDGALSEYVSTIASEFYFRRHDSFIKESKLISREDTYKWLDHVAYNLYADSHNGMKDLSAIKTRLQEVLKQYKNPTSADKVLAKKYSNYLYKKTEKLIKAG